MRFGGIQALSALSFDVAAGGITALIGPNGAGKTTAFNCITGFYRPTSGAVLLTHRDGAAFALHRMAGHRIASRARVARTFQNIRLFAGMTAFENLMVAQDRLAVLRGAAAHRAAVARARGWLERIGLLARANDPAGSLAYGDQRRLEIARAMCTAPVLLCLDEPAAGLNPSESESLLGLLRGIADEGVTILLIEHDMRLVMRLCDHVVVLDHGAGIADGPPAAVQADPAVLAAYLGQDEP